MARFNAATLVVQDLNENMTISTMKRGLRGSRFTYSLDKTLSRTYAKLLERAHKYMRANEGASTGAKQKAKVRRRSKRRVGLQSNQVDPRLISEPHPDDGVQGRRITGMTPIPLFLLLIHRS